MKTITFDTFFEEYKPQLNHFTSSPDNDNYTFETFGEELEYVKKQNNKQIWTTIDHENEEVWLIPGFHLVNRMNYYITTKEWESEYIQVNDNEMCSVEDAIEHCIVFASREFGIELNWNDVNKHFQKNLDFTFDNEMTTGRAKYTAIAYYEDSLNKEIEEFEDLIHDYYNQL